MSKHEHNSEKRDNLWVCEDPNDKDTLSVELTEEGMVRLVMVEGFPAGSAVELHLGAESARRLAAFLRKVADRCDGGEG